MADIASEELTTRQLWALLRKHNDDDTEIRNRLIVAYMDKAEEIALRYSDLGVDDVDLIQSADVALIEAIDSCIAEEKTNCSKFIIGYIDSYVRKSLMYEKKGCFYGKGIYATILQAQLALRQELDREPNVDEVSERTHILRSVVKGVLANNSIVENVSLEDKWGDVSKCCSSVSDPEFDLMHELEINMIRDRLERIKFGPSECKLIECMLAGVTDTRDLVRILGISLQRVHILMQHIAVKLDGLKGSSLGSESYIFENKKYECLEDEKVMKHRMMRDRQNNRYRY